MVAKYILSITPHCVNSAMAPRWRGEGGSGGLYLDVWADLVIASEHMARPGPRVGSRATLVSLVLQSTGHSHSTDPSITFHSEKSLENVQEKKLYLIIDSFFLV